jgi:hypothetical protein
MLTRKDIHQIAQWNGFSCTIDKEYDPKARGPQKSYDRVYIGWGDSKYIYPVDWFYNLQFSCKTINDVLNLFNKVKQNVEDRIEA